MYLTHIYIYNATKHAYILSPFASYLYLLLLLVEWSSCKGALASKQAVYSWWIEGPSTSRTEETIKLRITAGGRLFAQ